MKKIIVCVLLMGCVGITMAAQQTLGPQEATKTGLTSLITKVNAMMAELYGSVSTNSADRLAALEVIVTNAAVVATEVDAASAAALLIGKATATSVTIGATDAGVSIPGTLGVTGAATLTGNAIMNEIDARTATALLLGKATATSVTIGASDADVSVPGALVVTGTSAASGFKIGAQSGFSGIVTNMAPGGTNFVYYAGGIATNKVFVAQ